ncbi:MAG: hypothetical protein GKR89_15790 [Candidatus Latescibacteria bacterium]|nr:hypothetical protein [Candidatus Latescibacterota bacterium]
MPTTTQFSRRGLGVRRGYLVLPLIWLLCTGAAPTEGLPPAPIELSPLGIFAAIGPVRWGILLLTIALLVVLVAGLAFLTMPLARRRDLAAQLSSLKEWNTVLSTLCTILGPVGTYIGMIGSLMAMHQVAVAPDAVARLAAQAEFFHSAAQMFVSSLAGIGVGISMGLVNNLVLHHVLPDHDHPIEGQGMVAGTVGIVASWLRQGRLWVGRGGPRPRVALPAARGEGHEA